jgi:hypothetical protein
MKTKPLVQNGFALVATLIILVLIAVLVTGLFETTRVDRTSSRSHIDRIGSLNFAQMGVDQVVAQLADKTGNIGIPATSTTPATPGVNWVSAPGQIIASAPPANPPNLTLIAPPVNLYSGVANTTLVAPFECPDLNAVTLASPTDHLITEQKEDPANPNSNAVSLKLKWIYVRQDGTQDLNNTPVLTDTVNPIVGRFAYWTDDESCKVNYNTAWKRTQTDFAKGHPASINLPSLAGNGVQMSVDNADLIHNAITTDRFSTTPQFFNSPLDARRLGGSVATDLKDNRFSLTHYNHDPDATFLNEPRIVLTTKEQYAPRDENGNLLRDSTTGAPYFLDIGLPANSDPGIISTNAGAGNLLNVDDTTTLKAVRLNKTIKLLVKYLQTENWPMTTLDPNNPTSLQKKYYGNYSNTANPSRRLTQLALNIINYVRCKESNVSLVEPLRGIYDNNDRFIPSVAYVQGSFYGLTRTPLINEIGVSLNNANTSLTVKIELYLPLNYGLQSVNIGAPNTLYVKAYIPNPDPRLAPATLFTLPDVPILASECNTQSLILTKGNYVTITKAVTVRLTSRPTSLSLRVAFSKPSSGTAYDRLDVAPLIDGYFTPPGVTPLNLFGNIDCPVNQNPSVITSMEVNDPRVNKLKEDWQPCLSGNTFGVQNSIYKTLGNYIPQQDTTSAGLISDDSLYMPPPAPAIDTAVISAGELGYIHTGVECGNPPNPGIGGVPWRTLRLQPNNYGNTNTVPDWAFMDLFTVPVTVANAAKPIFRPHGSSAGGRVNINAQVQPFGNPAQYTPPVERTDPLVAVLEGVEKTRGGSTITHAGAQSIARNIYNHTLASGNNTGKAYPSGAPFSVYDSPGEIVEIAGVADGGEASESIVRGIGNLVTTRGNVFSVYTVGQSLKQTRGATPTIVVNGEQRLQTMIERYLDTTTPATPVVKFRSIYSRNLTP